MAKLASPGFTRETPEVVVILGGQLELSLAQPAAALDRPQLVRWMVGREIADHFPRRIAVMFFLYASTPGWP